MSQDVLSRPARRERESLDDLDTSVSISPTDILERLWRLAISKKTGLFLILGVGLLTLAGTLLVQAPAGVRGDKQAYAEWLKSVQPKYGGWTTIFDKLGLFTVFSSILFETMLVLLGVSIIACSVNRTPALWRKATRPSTHKNDSFYAHAPLRAAVFAPAAPSETLTAVRTVFRSHHYRTVADPKGDGLSLYADKFRWMPFGTIVAHVSLLLIMLGAFLTATTGFKDTQFTVPVGTTVPVGHGTNLSVEATAFTDSYYLDGSPKNYQSDIVLYQNGKAVAKKTVRVNHPLRWGGVSFYQSFFGVAAAMKVQSEAGKTVYDRGVPLLWQSKDGRHSVGQFALPASGLTVYVVTAASGQEDPEIKAGQAQVEVYRGNGDTPVAVKVLSQGKPVSIQGMRFTFERMRQFTGLIVTRDRGALFVWLGCALLALGVFLVLFFPHRRVWVQVRETQDGSEVRCGAMRREASRRDTAFESGFNRLAEDIQRAATPLGTHEGRAE